MLLTSTEWVSVPATQWRTNSMTKLVQLDTLSQWVSKFDLHVNTIGTSVGNIRPKSQELGPNRGALAARVLALEGGNGSASRFWVPGSCPWPTVSLDPGPVADNRNTRRKLQTNSDNENIRSAVLMRFLCSTVVWCRCLALKPKQITKSTARAAGSRLESFSSQKMMACS